MQRNIVSAVTEVGVRLHTGKKLVIENKERLI